MTEVMIAIALTTGACAFMFFVLPFLDARKSIDDQPAPPENESPVDCSEESTGGGG